MASSLLSVQFEKRIVLSNPTIEDIQKAVSELKSLMGYDTLYPYQKILVKFVDEVGVWVNRKRMKMMKEMKVNFFDSIQGDFCYTFHSATGFPISYIDFSRIFSLSIFEKAPECEKDKEIERLARKFHPNAWVSLRNDPEKMKRYASDHGTKVVNIKSKFPPYVIEQLKEAFDKKLKYSYSMSGKKRDLSVETKLCDDGEFRAWYSSEYAGCGNGSYYLLINPTTAAFREDD